MEAAIAPIHKPITAATATTKTIVVDYARRPIYKYSNDNRIANSNNKDIINNNKTKLILTTKPPPITHPTKPNNNHSTWKHKLCNTTIVDSDPTTSSSSSDILRLMDSLSLPISTDMYVTLIKECTENRDREEAIQLHNHVKKIRSKLSLSFINRLLLMHASCGNICFARPLFDQMPLRDFNSWAIMIVGYFHIDEFDEAISLFVEMHGSATGLLVEFPSWVMVCVLKSCMSVMDLDLGKQIHALLVKFCWCDDVFITGTLIDLYGKFGCEEDADLFFGGLEMPRDTISWTTRIVNHCREERFFDAVNDFKEMGRHGIRRNCFTFSSVLKACARINDGGVCGKQVHANAIKLGVESETFVLCGLIDMYGKCGLVREAENVFGMVSDKQNIAYWTSMLTNYVRNGCSVEAIKLLYQIKSAGLKVRESLLHEVTIACGAEFVEKGIL